MVALAGVVATRYCKCGRGGADVHLNQDQIAPLYHAAYQAAALPFATWPLEHHQAAGQRPSAEAQLRALMATRP